ncbi:MAG: fumarate hydratase C-terminal domain-containing protein [Deltaproteobacteria bacterium]|nr:fumarate hydratase C-terminal domain-containing protein [Deltaproteobacteria bacterium]
MKSHQLTAPLSEQSLLAMEAGDCFTLTGLAFTCRPLAYDRLLNSEDGERVSKRLLDLQANVLFHCGPLVKKEGSEWRMLGMVPMPSWLAGEERISKAIQTLGLRVVIGKGTLYGLRELLKSARCIHAVCAGNFSDYALKVKKVIEGDWLDLGLPEALWAFEVEEFGPFIVETDAKGNSLYKAVDEVFKSEAESILKELGIKLD